MRRNLLYLIYSLGLVGGATWLERTGWSMFNDVDEARNVPRSIRDNPGAYRSIYRYYPRYIGGK